MKNQIKQSEYTQLAKKFRYNPHYPFYYNGSNRVVATKKGNNEGSGTSFRYTTIIEEWEKKGGDWVLISSKEEYDYPSHKANDYIKSITTGFLCSNDMRVSYEE